MFISNLKFISIILENFGSTTKKIYILIEEKYFNLTQYMKKKK